MHARTTNTSLGLSASEAAQRLKRFGTNELPKEPPKNILQTAGKLFAEPMIGLLVGAGVIYLFLGEPRESLILLAGIFFIIGITLYQEQKTERTLAALRDLASPRALVIRDGKHARIPGKEVVPGDLVLLTEGDRVPADAHILECSHLSADESLLTGESAPATKRAWKTGDELSTPGGDMLPFIFSGTIVTSGHSLAEVYATGLTSEMGKIGTSLKKLVPEKSLLEKEVRRLVYGFTAFGAIVCAIVIVVYGASSGSWLKGILQGLALAMSLLPEEFPVVLTIFLAIGAWRISKAHVLTRNIPAIETLGSITALCVDKTGTLTMNHMTVRAVFDGNATVEIPYPLEPITQERISRIAEIGKLASLKHPTDPIERALTELSRYVSKEQRAHNDWRLIREYPFSDTVTARVHIWESPDGNERIATAAGAPETIFGLCQIEKKGVVALDQEIEAMAQSGLRVIGIAAKHLALSNPLSENVSDIPLAFEGLVGLEDPVRPGVRDSIRECADAGIKVAMITGDHASTATHIARSIGLSTDNILIGSQLDKEREEDLREKAPNTSIFARIIPTQKLRIVEALKARGEIVAMTGDGVNDAPALKSAHVGIAMGERGTDVAREAASLVLLDDNFSSIVRAIRMGRRVFDNLRKAMSYVFAVHIPIAGIALIPILIKQPIVLLPLHIALIELIIDPASSVVFEAETEEENIMKRPPRPAGESILNKRYLISSLFEGIIVFTIVALVYLYAVKAGYPENYLRAMAFAALIFSNLALIFSNLSAKNFLRMREIKKNKPMLLLFLGAILLLALVVYTPAGNTIFHFAPIGFADMARCVGAGMLSLFLLELVKRVRRATTALA